MSDNQLRGVILAGGTGSRLLPLTKVTNKHLLPVGEKPMIFHPIEKLVEAGIKDIMIITGTYHIGAVVGLLGSGSEFGCRFTYRVQDQAGGIAQALDLAYDFCLGHKFVVVLGDNIFEDSLVPFVEAFKSQNRGARLLLKDVHDPERYGVATLDGKKIVQIVEKPEKPESNMAVTGIYMFDNIAFEFIKNCKPSGRGELEISDVNDAYVKAGLCEFDTLEGWWTDAGTHESLREATKLVSQ
jgi:glucose-1-phosphate thymidylyltransferase